MKHTSENIINLLFDAGRGEATRLSMEAQIGTPVGELPRAHRRGYVFDGWYTARDGGERVTNETVVSATSDLTLYAHWVRSKEKKKSLFRLQRRTLVILLAALVCLSVATFVVLRFVVDTYEYTDPADGTCYYVRRVYDTVQEQRVYKLTTGDGTVLPLRTYTTSTNTYQLYETAAGTWVQVDADGGATTYAVVDVDGTEQVGFGDRVLLFPSIPQSEIYSIEVTNAHGTYTMYRDAEGNSYVKGLEEAIAVPDTELFASLCSHCGYTLSAKRIEDPIRDADGSFRTEYGLDGSRRFTVTRAETSSNGTLAPSGVSYTVYIGDALPSGGGYYAQLEGRDKVYVFSSDGASSSSIYHTFGETLLSPVETLISPMFTYPMTSEYYDVKNFFIARTGDSFSTDPDDIKLQIEFSYVQNWERNGTLDTTQSYRCDYNLLSGFRVNSTAATAATYDLYRAEPLRCVKLSPEKEDLVRYGLFDQYRYLLHFGMWLDLTEQFTDASGALLSGFLPDDAKVAYRNSYSSTETATATGGAELTLDMLVNATIYSFTVNNSTAPKDGEGSDDNDIEETLEYRVTVANKLYFYGGDWLRGEALERELDSGAYSYRSDYGCDYRYDAATGCYFYRLNGYVYYGTNASRQSGYDNSGANVERLLENAISISEKTADGTYYLYNALCAQIVEVSEEYLSFLEWDAVKWVDTSFFPIPLAYVTELELTNKETEIRFRMDNTASDQSESFDSTDINIAGTDGAGNSFDAWGRMTFYCSHVKDGVTVNSTWLVTPTDFTIRNTDTGDRLQLAAGEELVTNAFGESVRIYTAPLTTTDGARVMIGADTVTVTKNGETTTYPRYTVQNFRQFYKALMYATLEGTAQLDEAEPSLRDQILDAIERGDDSGCQLVLRITCEDTAAENNYFESKNNRYTYVYRFYQYTKGKSYITVQLLDADGKEVTPAVTDDSFRFYVKASFVDKLIADAERVMRGEPVTAESKT